MSTKEILEHDGLAELKALASIISSSVDQIEIALKTASMPFPSIHTPFTPQSDAARNLPEVSAASALITAAAAQIIATIRPPFLHVATTAILFNISAALRVAEEAHVAEILRAAGPNGLHIKDIAVPSGVDPDKLARLLRVLATHHIFEEVAPDVFAHNRVSSVMDTGKNVEQILKDPQSKHRGTFGMTASIGHLTDEIMKTVSYLAEAVMDPVSGHNNDVHDLAFNRAFNVKGTFWDWLDQPDQAYRLERFGIAMEGAKNAAPPNAIVEGLDWNSLGEGALVVDVGGGIGAQSLTLAKNCPNLKFIIQDRPEVVKVAEKIWDDELPGARATTRVQMQAHDFFTSQPVKNADVFLIRMILHDWPNAECVTILRHLREAAKPSTQLVIVDNIMAYACKDAIISDIPGAADTPHPQEPLLPNMGAANMMSYLTDVQMMAITGGVERTLPQVDDLLKKTGWKISRVHHGAPFVLSHQKVIAVPA